jgi:flagellum-specific peptidoglycan hydrolase FlgJ
MDIGQTQFLNKAIRQATQSGHIFPEIAGCEAALESGYGRSALAIQANNLFGMKAHVQEWSGETISIPTREFLDHGWVMVQADWVKYADWAECFLDRMATLKRCAPIYPHYQAALDASNYIVYINEVSKSWSTDPERAAKVIHIFIEWTELR